MWEGGVFQSFRRKNQTATPDKDNNAIVLGSPHTNAEKFAASLCRGNTFAQRFSG
jgi:hypothetical protein